MMPLFSLVPYILLVFLEDDRWVPGVLSTEGWYLNLRLYASHCLGSKSCNKLVPLEMIFRTPKCCLCLHAHQLLNLRKAFSQNKSIAFKHTQTHRGCLLHFQICNVTSLTGGWTQTKDASRTTSSCLSQYQISLKSHTLHHTDWPVREYKPVKVLFPDRLIIPLASCMLRFFSPWVGVKKGPAECWASLTYFLQTKPLSR